MVSRTFKYTKRQMGRNVLDIIMEEYSIEDIKEVSRQRDLVDARKIYTRYLRDEKTRTFQQIGDILGKDHSSAVYMYKQSKWLIEYDKKAKYVWGLINGTVEKENLEEKEILQDISDLFRGINDIDMYFFALDKLKTIIKAKRETLCMK